MAEHHQFVCSFLVDKVELADAPVSDNSTVVQRVAHDKGVRFTFVTACEHEK